MRRNIIPDAHKTRAQVALERQSERISAISRRTDSQRTGSLSIDGWAQYTRRRRPSAVRKLPRVCVVDGRCAEKKLQLL